MLQQNQSIKSWAEDDRPREKLCQKGKKHLSNSELISILLNSGSKNKSALDLAKEILQSCHYNLQDFFKMEVADLCKFKGIGPAKAIRIVAALELGRRRKESEAGKRVKITCSNDSYQFLRPFFEDLKLEEFYVIYLNRGNKIIKCECLSIGGLSGTVVDSRVIFKQAVECLASAVIVAHNHPSGQLFPSEEDVKITRKLTEIGKIMEIPVLDHLILTDNGYFSFADSGKLS